MSVEWLSGQKKERVPGGKGKERREAVDVSEEGKQRSEHINHLVTHFDASHTAAGGGGSVSEWMFRKEVTSQGVGRHRARVPASIHPAVILVPPF